MIFCHPRTLREFYIIPSLIEENQLPINRILLVTGKSLGNHIAPPAQWEPYMRSHIATNEIYRIFPSENFTRLAIKTH